MVAADGMVARIQHGPHRLGGGPFGGQPVLCRAKRWEGHDGGQAEQDEGEQQLGKRNPGPTT